MNLKFDFRSANKTSEGRAAFTASTTNPFARPAPAWRRRPSQKTLDITPCNWNMCHTVLLYLLCTCARARRSTMLFAQKYLKISDFRTRVFNSGKSFVPARETSEGVDSIAKGRNKRMMTT